MKMKVLYLTNIPSPYRVDFFNKLGMVCELTVLYERKTALDRETTWLSEKAFNFTEIFLRGLKIGNDSGFCPNVIKYLNKSYDIIVVGGYSTPTGMIAINYMKIKGIPFILNCDGGMIKKDKRIIYFLKKYYISSASAWLSTAHETNKYLLYYGANKSNIYKYPFTSLSEKDILNSPISKAEKLIIRKKLDLVESRIIITVGQFIYRKGFDVLINAAKFIDNNVGIYIIGGEPTEEYLNIIKEFGITNVHFLGFKSKEELVEYYKAADIFVLPTREDIWGLVINEAMSFGLPIITTNKCVAGIELIENNVNGYIIPSDNSLEIIEKINNILENEEVRKKMQINSLKKISSYTIDNMVRKHIEIFKIVLKKRRKNAED